MKIEINNLEGKITTDNKELLHTLVEKYSFLTDGAFYTTAYKRGLWDGKKRFISKEGYFKSGLLGRIIKDLEVVSIKPEVLIHNYTPTFTSPDLKLKDFELREYQQFLVHKAFKAQKAIINLPTGGGKTAIMASLMNNYKEKKILVLFHRKQLLVQTYEFLKKHTDLDIGVVFGEGNDIKDITLATYQSIERIIGTPVAEPDILMVDEVHEFSKGKLTSKIISIFPSARHRFGFTATVPTSKIPLYTLEGCFGSILESPNTEELIEGGYLAKPNIQILTVSLTSSGVEYLDYYKDLIIKNEKRNNLIKDICANISYRNPKIIILVQSLEHAEILQKLLPDSMELEGHHSVTHRNKIISKFRSKVGKSILIGTNILQTGVDIKEITHLINARGLKSDIATLQALGRALRVDKDQEVFVYDFLDKGSKVLEKHSRSRIRTYKKEGHLVEILPEIK